MADDMGIGDTSAYLDINLMEVTEPISKTVKTPHIEKFAKEGMIFTDAHAPASMCSSTRYSLLTGRLAHRDGQVDPSGENTEWNCTLMLAHGHR